MAGGLGLGIVVMLEIGRRIRLRHMRLRGAEAGKGFGAVEGAVFGLMGLLIAFTFQGAAARFDIRRAQIVDEANNIGTAYLRLDLVAPEPRAALQDKLRRYLDARLAAYRAVPDSVAVRAHLAEAAALQQQIWSQAVAATEEVPGTQAAMLLLPALNAVFDIASTRAAATLMHPPTVIYCMLFVLALFCSLLAGYDMALEQPRSWVHVLTFAIILAMAVYVILDLEYPRLGLIRIDNFDQILVKVREGMK